MTEPGRIGVLLVNLGTPDAPTPAAVRRFLAEFLSDRRVVEIPPILWQPILHGVVLPTRPRRVAHAYRLIWDEARNLSPLRAITEDQAALLGDSFANEVRVDFAMRYGAPAIGDRLAALKREGVDHILLVPLFPQYCGATTASIVDAVGRSLARMDWQPALRVLPAYFDDPGYIAALVATIGADLASLDFAPDLLIASFHGLPVRAIERGDPYRDQCDETARLLSATLERPLLVGFQSRFGGAKWLEPATDRLLAELPARCMTKVAVVAPGFAADCLETLEELALRGRDRFLAAGGTDFAYLPCLNARPAGIAMLRGLVARELEGWVAAN